MSGPLTTATVTRLIIDATTAGKSMITAVDSAAQRTLLELGTAAQSDATDFATPADLTSKADLVGGVVPTSQIPSVAITEYLGEVAGQTAMLALSAGDRGDWCVRTDTGSVWVLVADDSSLIASWTELTYPAAPVTSVNSETGTIVLSAADVGAATEAQGSLADSAVQPGDLGTAAAEDVGAFATAVQGALADSATQPGDLGELALLDEDELTLVESPPIFLSPQDADAVGGTNVVDFVIPFAFSLTSVEFRCRESDPPTGSAAQLDVLLAGTTIFSTNPTIDAGEFSSTTAATAPVLSSNPTALTSGQRLQFDLDQIGASDAGRGYYAILRGTRTNA